MPLKATTTVTKTRTLELDEDDIERLLTARAQELYGFSKRAKVDFYHDSGITFRITESTTEESEDE